MSRWWGDSLVKAKILISLIGLAGFGFPASVLACSIADTPEARESQARSAAEARLNADVIVIGYLSDPIAIEDKSNKENRVRIYGVVSPKKVLRGITKKTYRIFGPRHSCMVNPPRNQLIQLYLNKRKNVWDVVAYDRLSQ
jgi:hypothetical protein